MVKLTRRAMLACSVASSFSKLFGQDNCAPPSGTAVDFVIPKLQNITRKPIATLSANEVARLRLAYKKLRDLTVSDPTDPRGWMQQASVHCWQCGASGHNIHGSWTFLPWHRAFLYFHERILCKLLNDNSFRLPYWSWDDAHTRDLPAIYRAAKVGSDPNPLYDANRSGDAVKGNTLPGSVFPSRQNPMNAGNFASFGGSGSSAGSLEMGPHGRIHMWTGTADDPWADMGNLMLAGRDPIFFAHHCNLDRLWAEWNRRNPLAHANPTDAAFLARSFQFFDENKQLVNIRVQDVLNPVPLGFSYLPGAALSHSKLPKWTPLRYDPATHLIQLPDKLRAALTAPSVLATQRSLVVEEVQLPMKSGTYNVFVGDPPAAGADPSAAPNYLGYIGIIVSEHVHENKCSLVLNPADPFLQAAGGPGALLTFAAAGTAESNRLEFTSAYLTEE